MPTLTPLLRFGFLLRLAAAAAAADHVGSHHLLRFAMPTLKQQPTTSLLGPVVERSSLPKGCCWNACVYLHPVAV